MFYGHAVCWVLAETLEAARLGAAAVEVDYEPLPALVTIARRSRRRASRAGSRTWSAATSRPAWPASAHVFSGEFEFSGQEHFYLETHCALAQVDEAGQVFVQSSTQHPSETQEIVAHVLGRPSHEVTVQCLRMGGGFGGKEMQPHGFAAIAALGATLTGRPVRLRLTRTQDMTMSGKRHGFHARWRVGFDDDGRLQALDATLTSDGGWSLDLSEPVLARALCHIDNAYWIPNVRVNGRIAKTNKTSQTAFRGFGGPQGMLVIEDILGRCAPLLGLDAATLRRRNFYRAGQTTPYGQPVRHPRAARGGLAAGPRLQRLRRADRRDRRVQRRAPAHQAGAGDHAGEVRHLVQPHRVQPGRRARARLQGRLGPDQPRRHRDGPGPAHQDAAGRGDRRWGSRWQRVRLAPTRTDKVPNTSATAASSGADLNGGAVKNACEQIRDAAGAGGGRSGSASTPPTSASLDGRVQRPGRRPASEVSWEEVVRAGVLPARPAVGGRLLPHRGPVLGLVGDAGVAVQVLRLRRRGQRGRGRRLHRGVPAAPGRHRARRRRQPLPAGRPRADRGRLRAGRRLADPRGPALGRERRSAPRAARHPGGEHLQAAELLGDAGGLQRQRCWRTRPRRARSTAARRSASHR